MYTRAGCYLALQMKTIVIVVGVREDSMNVLIPKIEKKKIQSILLVELVMLPYQEIECC